MVVAVVAHRHLPVKLNVMLDTVRVTVMPVPLISGQLMYFYPTNTLLGDCETGHLQTPLPHLSPAPPPLTQQLFYEALEAGWVFYVSMDREI